MAEETEPALIEVGERLARTVRYSREDIAAFAKLSLDENPLHLDTKVAQRARFGEIIASGQHTAAGMMGLLATHFSRRVDGVARQMLCLNMNFSFKGPVFADQQLLLQWQVSNVDWSSKLQGQLGHVDGTAAVGRGKPVVIARGTILVTKALA